MMHVNSVGCKDAPSGSGGVGQVAWALMLAVSCFLVHCGDNSSTSTSSGGAQSAGASSGGTTISGGSEPGGAEASGGTQASGTGGAAAGADSDGGATSGGSSEGGATSEAGTSGSSDGGASSGGSNEGGATSEAGTSGSSDGGASSGGSNEGGATSEGGTSGSSDGGAGGSTVDVFTVSSPGWENLPGCGPDAKTSCAPLPTEMTRSGGNISPELTWTGAPEGTQSFVVLLQDLNNQTAHWILWNISATVTTLAAGVDQTTATPAVPAGSQQCGKGTDAATDNGYYGPGAPCNVYELIVYALSIATFSPTNATDPEEVRTQLNALGASILGEATLRGRTDTGC